MLFFTKCFLNKQLCFPGISLNSLLYYWGSLRITHIHARNYYSFCFPKKKKKKIVHDFIK